MPEGNLTDRTVTPLRWITCLDDDTRYGYASKGNVEAMEALIYYLNLKARDTKAQIKLAGGGRTLYFEHRGKTYAIIDCWLPSGGWDSQDSFSHLPA